MRGLHANRQKIVGMFGDSATLLSSDKGQGAYTMLEDCSAQHVREILVVFLGSLHEAPAVDIADIRLAIVRPEEVESAHLCLFIYF